MQGQLRFELKVLPQRAAYLLPSILDQQSFRHVSITVYICGAHEADLSHII